MKNIVSQSDPSTFEKMLYIEFKYTKHYHRHTVLDMKESSSSVMLTLLESQSCILVGAFISSYVCSILPTSGFGKPGTTL